MMSLFLEFCAVHPFTLKQMRLPKMKQKAIVEKRLNDWQEVNKVFLIKQLKERNGVMRSISEFSDIPNESKIAWFYCKWSHLKKQEA